MKRLSVMLAMVVAFAFSATAHAETLYAPAYFPEQVFGYDTGFGVAFNPLPGSPFDAAAGGLISWNVSADGSRAVGTYLGPGAGGVRGFSVAANGAVTAAQDKIPWAGIQGTSVAWAPSGDIVYVGTRYYPGSGAAGIRAYTASAGGQLTELPGSPFATANDYWDLAMTPDGKRLIASRGSQLDSIPVNADGTLGTAVPTGVNGSHLAMTPGGQFVIATTSTGGDSEIRAYEINTDGSLTQRGAESLGGSSMTAPVVSPNGRFIYAGERNSDTLTAAALTPGGAVTTVGSKIPLENIAIVGVSPDGGHLYYSLDDADTLVTAPLGADGRPGAGITSTPYNPGEPVKLAFLPGAGTTAKAAAKPDAQPLKMNFSGAASTAKRGGVSRYAWDLGDGTAAAGVAPAHKYAKPGVYNAKLTTYDEAGCADAFVYNGQAVLCTGGAAAVTSFKVDTPPWVTSLKIAPKSVGKRATIKYKLTEAGRVTFTVERPVKAWSVSGKCRKARKKPKGAKRCTLWTRAAKSFRANGKSRKTNSLKFARRQLAAGSYRLKAVAVDKAKNKGAAKTVAFKVKRR